MKSSSNSRSYIRTTEAIVPGPSKSSANLTSVFARYSETKKHPQKRKSAIQNVTSGISQIATEISKYTAAYTTQETAEKKVAQVMRNTMNATEAEVESIKKLCSAQQELGVIGDEVQLSGAQEYSSIQNG